MSNLSCLLAQRVQRKLVADARDHRLPLRRLVVQANMLDKLFEDFRQRKHHVNMHGKPVPEHHVIEVDSSSDEEEDFDTSDELENSDTQEEEIGFEEGGEWCSDEERLEK
ncbi:hypothetical protein DICA2_F18778 [Diutina catenulata]